MSGSEKHPKSILKTSIPSAHAATNAISNNAQSPRLARALQPRQQQQWQQVLQSKSSPDPRHLAIALHHAHRIQAQKDAEALILTHILELITLPSSASADPASPSATDAAIVKSRLVPFQPSDYDNMILERNIEGLCGYVLCPREHRKGDPKAKFRILWGPKGSGARGHGREMNVVPKERLEMWCSDECAEHAMYVRVQLTEDPVWERRAGDTHMKEIVLLGEVRAVKKAYEETQKAVTQQGKEELEETSRSASGEENASESVVNKMNRLAIDGLAFERGDSKALRDGRVDVHIVEKKSTPGANSTAPMSSPINQNGGPIEGYTPKRRPGTYESCDDGEDLLGQI